MTAVYSDDDAKHGFGHLFDLIFDEITEGVRDYYRDHPHVNHKHAPHTMRLIKRDYVVHRLWDKLGSKPGVHAFKKNQTTYFGVNSHFLGRVHKLGTKLAARVSRTQMSLAFQRNEPYAKSLGEGFDEVTCVRLGYMDVPAKPLDPRVFITCPHGDDNAWFIELNRIAGIAVVPTSIVATPDDIDDLVEVIPNPVRKGHDE